MMGIPETLNTALIAIRQHEPEEQNIIIERLLKEIAGDRAAKMYVSEQDTQRHTTNLNAFVQIGRQFEMNVKDAKANIENQNIKP